MYRLDRIDRPHHQNGGGSAMRSQNRSIRWREWTYKSTLLRKAFSSTEAASCRKRQGATEADARYGSFGPIAALRQGLATNFRGSARFRSVLASGLVGTP